MSFEIQYEQMMTQFEATRKELIDTITNATPKVADIHKREWRVQQLQNAIHDIKSTIAACNIQIDKERSILDELSAENSRLMAQERKLLEDVKLLEGVTGMQATLPVDGESDILDEIERYASIFRDKASDFYFSMPMIHQEITPDSTLAKESDLMTSTLHDYIELVFRYRNKQAVLSKDLEGYANHADKLKRDVGNENAKFNKKFRNLRKDVEDEFGDKQKALADKLQALRNEYKSLVSNIDKQKNKYENTFRRLRGEEEKLRKRCMRLSSFNNALRENMRRRSQELEFELDRFQNRLKVIQANPHTADAKLINMALVTTKKSRKLYSAIRQMRNEIAMFNEALRNSN